MNEIHAAAPAPADTREEEEIAAETLVEEVSIDGMCGVYQAVVSGIDIDRAWDLHPQVSVRPEPFGALLYHFGTRRLSFLKDRRLLAVVRSLSGAPTARAAFAAAGVPAADLERYGAALAVLARSSMVVERAEGASS